MDGFPPRDREGLSPVFDDSFSFSEFMNLEGYAELCCTSSSGQELVSSGFAGRPLGDAGENSSCLDVAAGALGEQIFHVAADNSPSGRIHSPFLQHLDQSVIPRSLNFPVSLQDKMLAVLQSLKDPVSSGILVQFWVPVKHGEQYVLSTTQQPYLLDRVLAGYREISRKFTFPMSDGPVPFPGVPGRVFISGSSEWTSDVGYYNKDEYLRADHARHHKVHGSIAMPVIDPSENSCCAVLEFVTLKEKSNFKSETESICRALQAVNLMTVYSHAQQQKHAKTQADIFAEILDIFQAVCHAHMLPLALTWMPFNGDDDSFIRRCPAKTGTSTWNGHMLYIEESACYVNDMGMQGFLQACSEQVLKEGKGIAGKALQSNHVFFCSDVKGYSIFEYPLVHHARRFGLHAAVAIRLRSIHTGDEDYILEIFLPVSCKSNSDQQLLLHDISNTMQKSCRSLRTVSDAEITGGKSSATNDFHGAPTRPFLSDVSVAPSPPSHLREAFNPSAKAYMQEQNLSSNGGNTENKVYPDPRRNLEKKRNTIEKEISLGVLQQYFSGSLKDAAKSLGVCPTTLKRICRQHGISRWPSRKINKVNRSLKKIRTVIESVQGVDGAIRYDPLSGNLVAAVTSSENVVLFPSESMQGDSMLESPNFDEDHTKSVEKRTYDDAVGLHEGAARAIPSLTDEENKTFPPTLGCSVQISQVDLASSSQQAELRGPTHWIWKSNDASSCLIKGGWSGANPGDSHPRGPSQNIFPLNQNLVVSDENDTGNNMGASNNNPCSSATTGSSNSSELSFPPGRSCRESTNHAGKSSSAITVKATYKDDTVRFKFVPSMGWFQLAEEVGKRFHLSSGTFQLKYMDDEDEWVMLTTDADLQECVEITESIGSRSVKVLVRDTPSLVGSSTSSNFS